MRNPIANTPVMKDFASGSNVSVQRPKRKNDARAMAADHLNTVDGLGRFRSGVEGSIGATLYCVGVAGTGV